METKALTEDIAFRPANHDDEQAIIAFQLAMARETEGIDLDLPTCQAGVGEVFLRPDRGRYFVAEVSGAPVASLMITYEWSDWRNRTVWWIQSVYVVPEQRNRGVYAGLYRYVKALAEEDPSIAGIRLYVDRRNLGAQRVYSRLGMNGEHYQLFEWMKDF